MKIFLLPLFFIFICFCQQGPGKLDTEIQEDKISKGYIWDERCDIVEGRFMRLIVRPEDYYDKKVSVQGYLSLKLNFPALYFSKEHYERSLDSYINLKFPVSLDTCEECKEFDKKYVDIIGVFKKRPEEFSSCRSESGYIIVEHINEWGPFPITKSTKSLDFKK